MFLDRHVWLLSRSTLYFPLTLTVSTEFLHNKETPVLIQASSPIILFPVSIFRSRLDGTLMLKMRWKYVWYRFPLQASRLDVFAILLLIHSILQRKNIIRMFRRTFSAQGNIPQLFYSIAQYHLFMRYFTQCVSSTYRYRTCGFVKSNEGCGNIFAQNTCREKVELY